MSSTKEVAVIDFTKFDIAQLPELKGKKQEIAKLIKANPIVEVTDNASYELAKKSRTAVKTLRTSLEKEKKEVNDRIKKNVLEVVANEYDSLINDVKQSEVNRQEKVDTWETAKENERLEKLRLEQERVDGIKKRISDFFTEWSAKVGSLQFANLEDFEIEFGETLVNYDKSELQEFEVLFTDAVSNLTYMLSEKKSTLLAQENIRLEQIRLAEEREKQEADSKRIAEEMRIEREKYLAEQKAIEEKNRIAQEKFLAEKREFEEKQAEAKYQERCKQISDLGFVLNENNIAYQKGLHYLNLEDIRLANDDMRERELEDAKNVKDFSEIATVDTGAMEVEFEEVANYHEDDTHEEATKGLSTRLKAGNLPIEKELTWGDLLLKFNWQKIKEGNTEPELSHFIKWLSENYNIPTPKI
jgi:hypothetical protein